MSVMPQLTTRWQTPATRWGRRIGLALAVGVVAGLAAALLDQAIHHGSEFLIGRFTHFGEADFVHFEWAILLLPAAGGLLAGLLVYLGAPQSAGHGVDALTRAFHRQLGRLSLRGPAVKAGGAAIVISAGGSAGPEGPIAALGAALGATIARFFPLTPQERRVLLVAGCAAGIGAIFRCPLGGALFATSILYREPEFESDAIVPSFVASVMGYSMYTLLLGYREPMIGGVESLLFLEPWHLPWYAILGLLCGATSIVFFFCLRFVERGIVPRAPLPRWMLPALGGLGTGAIACLLPQVMDGRYVFIQSSVNGVFFDGGETASTWVWWAAFFGLIALAKCAATALTVGSGAPGGVLGPSVFIGGAVGACVGSIGQALSPDAFPDDLRRALIPVGMAGVLAAGMRIPLAAIVMTMEMTGSFGLIAPLMLTCVVSYLIGRRWGLNDEQVRTAADSPTHAADPIVHLLESWRVGELMQKQWPMSVSPGATLEEIIEMAEPGTRPLVAVTEGGELKGIISATDLGEVMGEAQSERALIADDIMNTKLITLDEDTDVYTALTTFARVDHEVLPVMSHGDEGRWVGMLVRRQVVDRLHQELHRSHEAAFAEHQSLRELEKDVRLDHLVMGAPVEHGEIQKLFVPMDAAGKSLRECDFRRRYNIEVVAIEKTDGSIECPPDPDTPLSTRERLLAVTWRK
jgi:CIC family chloride channel protein